MAINRRVRWQVFRRDGFRCGYCGLSAQDGAVLEADHVHPRSQGGSDEPSNLITACSDCNSGKSDTPVRVVEALPTLDLAAILNADLDDEREVEGFFGSEWAVAQSEDWEMALSRWLSGFTSHPGLVEVGRLQVAYTLADETGMDELQLIEAARLAGEAQSSDLLNFFGPDENENPGLPEFILAKAFLARFIPAEVIPAIRQAGDQRGDDFFPSFTAGTIESAEVLRKRVIENGRDSTLLREWLNRLPWGHGSKCMVAATAKWDAVWRGRSSRSALECSDEVVELAVALALDEETQVARLNAQRKPTPPEPTRNH